MLILSAAARLLAERGQDGASMRDIAAESGVMMGTLYHYYQSKDHLIRDVHETGVVRIRLRVEAAVAAETDPWARFEAAAVAHLEALLDPDPFFRVVQTPPPRLPSRLKDEVIALRDSYEAIQKSLVAALPLRPGVDRGLLRLGLIGMLNAVPNWHRPGGSTAAEIARAFVRMLRDGADATAR